MYLRIFLTLTLLLRNLSSLAEEKQEPIDCEDVIQENEELKAEIKWLNDVITNNQSPIISFSFCQAKFSAKPFCENMCL